MRAERILRTSAFLNRIIALIAAVAGLILAMPASAAILGEAAEAPTAPQSAAPAIAADTEDGDDDRIAARISGIFSELPSLQGISVAVEAGVVTLSGTVADAEAISRAEGIAGRVTGVVTVENKLQRDLSVEGGLGTAALGERFDSLVQMLPLAGVALAVALAVGALGYFLASLTRLWQRITPNIFLAELISSAIRFVFVILGVVIALDMLGAGALLGAVLGGAGVVGIALGFAMRDTIENYVASLMLSLRQPFRANDHVLIDDREGRVIRLTSRATILMTLDGNHLRIPNSTVFKAVILNFTTNPQRRFEFALGIDADDDPDAARGLGRERLGALDYVLKDPAPEARVLEVGDSNIVLQFLGWIDQREADFHKARSRAIAVVKGALEEGGFALPEPIYRLRFDQRTGPLPFTNIGEFPKAGAASSAPLPAPPRPPAPAHDSLDVSPDDEVARMVEQERATPGGDGDLLDSSRPVE